MADDDLLIRVGLTEKQYLAAIARMEAQSVKAAKGMTDKFTKANKRIAKSADNLNRSTSVLAKGGLRQVSMQMSQVAQQGAVTGNYLQALSVQAADIALIFGPAGIAIGALVPVLYGVAQGFLGAAEKAESMEDKIENLSSAVKALEAINGLASQGIGDLVGEYGNLGDEAQRIFNIQKQLAQINAQKAFGAAVGGVADGLGLGDLASLDPALLQASSSAIERLVEQYVELRSEAEAADGAQADLLEMQADALSEIITSLESADSVYGDLVEKLGISRDEAQRLAVLFADVSAAQGAQAQADAMERLAGYLFDATDKLATADEETQNLYDSLLQAAQEALKFAAIDMASGVTVAADEAARLHTNLLAASQVIVKGMAADEAVRRAGGDPAEFFDQRGREYGSPGAGVLNPPRGKGVSKAKTSNKKKKRGSGGGGQQQDPFIAELESLVQTLASQEDLQIESFARQQAMLEEALQKKLVTQQEYAELMEASNLQHQERMSEIDVYRYGDGLQKTEAFMGSMATALQNGNSKMQAAAEKFAAVETLINAWRAHNQVLADPSLPWFAKIPTALATLSAGMGAVQAIKGGGGGGAGVAASGGPVAAPQVSQQVAISLQGDVFSGAAVRGLINSINEEVEAGAVLRIV